jgi:hypothetical protein
MNEATNLVVFALPEPAYSATIAISLPEQRVDMPEGPRVRNHGGSIPMETPSISPD